MYHLFNNRPSILSIVERQRLAFYRLNESKTTRSGPEVANYRRHLQPVPLADVELPKLPLVRAIGETTHYAVLGEVAQTPGKVLLIDLATGAVNASYTTAQLELVPPIGHD